MSGSAGFDWLATLQPASWNGVPFAVRGGEIRRGRRVAVHEYPFRDDVWVEDMGRATRLIRLTGFLVGDDVYAQRDAFVAAAEMAGPGQLVHPSLGSVSCSLVNCALNESRERGRAVALELEFIEGKPQQFPSSSADTIGQVGLAADGAVGACDLDFTAAAPGGLLGSVGSALQSAQSAVAGTIQNVQAGISDAIAATGLPDAISAVEGFTRQAQSIVGDATGVFNAVRGLPGNFGRFAAGSRITLLPGITTVSAAIGAMNGARATVLQDCADAQRLIGLL